MMKSKTVLITGSTDGIGLQTAMELAGLGANILIHGKNREKAEEVCSTIFRETGNNKLEVLIGDLSSIKGINDLSDQITEKYHTIDVLINNAGVLSKQFHRTVDGYERTFIVNYLSAYMLTLKLFKPLLNANQGRIIFVTSISHSNSPLLGFSRIHSPEIYSGYDAYALTKLCQLLYTYELSSRIKETNITVNALHPGMIGTKLLRDGLGINGASLEIGALTPVYLATDPQLEKISGKYFVNKTETRSSPLSYRLDYREKLMEYSQQLSGISIEETIEAAYLNSN